MANKINLPVYKMTATEFVSSFKKKGLKKKFVFRCELLSIKENDAAFGLVGYAASKTLGKWKYGKPIRLTQVEGKSYQFSLPLIFGNNELVPKRTPVVEQSPNIKPDQLQEIESLSPFQKIFEGF